MLGVKTGMKGAQDEEKEQARGRSNGTGVNQQQQVKDINGLA